jgi:NADPH2:quinone reductase
VASIGAEVSGFAKGDAVVGQTIVGALAERVVAREEQLVPVPESIALPIAATMLQSYSTALFALTRRVSIQEGDTVLVLGAGGGVGLACVDVATSLGAHVIAVASSEEKRSLAVAIGAKSTINPDFEDVKLRARELSNSGVDIVVDPVGGAIAESALRALGPGGRYLVVGFASGTIPSIPLNLVLLNNREIIGIDLGAVTLNDPKMARMINYEVVSGVFEHRYRPTAPEVVPMARAGAALKALRQRELSGKIAVDIWRSDSSLP